MPQPRREVEAASSPGLGTTPAARQHEPIVRRRPFGGDPQGPGSASTASLVSGAKAWACA
jgi:hypothetical protein